MTQKEYLRHNLNIVVRTFLMYGIFLLAFYSYVSIWMILICNIILYFSAYVSVHEIGHNRNNKNLSLVARMLPLATPIWGGVRSFQKTHYMHHLYLMTSQDPWLVYYEGHPLKALFFNCIEPENNFYNFIKYEGFDKEIVINCLLNFSFLCVNIILFREYYLLFWISTRIIHGFTVFMFNFYLHRSSFSTNASYGVYERSEILKPLAPLLQLIWGKGVIHGFMYHNRHHCIGQWDVQPQHYDLLEDTGSYTPHIKKLPVELVVNL